MCLSQTEIKLFPRTHQFLILSSSDAPKPVQHVPIVIHSGVYQHSWWTPLQNTLASICPCKLLFTNVPSLEGALAMSFFFTNNSCLLLWEAVIEKKKKENKQTKKPTSSFSLQHECLGEYLLACIFQPCFHLWLHFQFYRLWVWFTVLCAAQFPRLAGGMLRQQLSQSWLPSSQLCLRVCTLHLLLEPV